jgi:hypothetical protein
MIRRETRSIKANQHVGKLLSGVLEECVIHKISDSRSEATPTGIPSSLARLITVETPLPVTKSWSSTTFLMWVNSEVLARWKKSKEL